MKYERAKGKLPVISPVSFKGLPCKLVVTADRAFRNIVDQGGKVLFVGTKDSAKQIVVDEATRSGSFYIANRWLGGTLTNFRTILGRTKKLKELEDMEAAGEFDKLPKKG